MAYRVGNKLRGEGMFIAPELYDLEDEQLRTLLMDYFLIPFKQDETYRFAHDSDLALNELYNYCSAIFDHPKSLYEHLYILPDTSITNRRTPKYKAASCILPILPTAN